MPSDPTETPPPNGVPAAASSLPFDRMFEASPLAACLTRRADGRFMAINRAWEALTGLSREQVIGRTGVELGLWHQVQDREQYVNALQFGDGPSCATMIRGQLRHVRMLTSVIEHGAEPALLVYLLDISHEVEAEKERDRTQEALQAANRDLQQQVELHAAIEKTAQVGHWTNAPSDEEVIWSPGLYEITGLTPQPTLRRGLGRGGIHPDDMPAWLAAREACDGSDVEFRWTRPDGQVRWMRTRISQTAVKGIPRTDFGVVQDITPQRDAIRVQAEQLSLLQNITARVPGVVFQGRVPVKGWGNFQYVSDMVRDLIGLEPEQLYLDGRALFTRVHPDDVMPMSTSIWESTTQRTFWCQAFRVNHPTKGLRWCSAEGLPQLQPDGSVLWHGYVHDVTEARQAAQEMERQHRMLDAVRLAQAAYIEADDKRQAFDGLLTAFLAVTDSAFGFVGEVLYDDGGLPYLKTHAITNIAWNDVTRQMVAEQMDAGLEFRNLKTLFGHSLVTGETVITNDPASDPRSAGLPQGHPPMLSYLGIPLAIGGKLIAMVALANTPGGYREEDVEFLQPLLGTVRQLVMARRGHAERQRSRLQLQATSALLAEKSAALQVTLDSISQGLSKMDATGRVTVYNRRLLELLDLPDELLSSQPSHEFIVRYQTERGDFGPGFELVEPAAREYISTHKVPAPDSYWRRTRDGRTLEIRSRTLPEGGLVRTYTDVTPYIEAEEALRDERQRLEWVLEATGPGIWELDVTTEQLMFSERWAALLGYRQRELEAATRDTWRALVHPDDLARAQSLLETHLRGESPVYDCDLRMRHKRGDWLWFNDRGRVHQRDENGAPLYMSGTLLDIHLRVTAQEEVRALNASLERRVAERTAELERSMRDMEVISYSIAHDLRAPLRSVNGFASLVEELDGEHLSPEGRMMFVRIVAASRNMGQMITDMLELLRVVRVEIEPVAVDMNALARSVVEALAPGVPHARINLHPLPRVMGDAKLLRQLLANLMDNALKYSRHRGEPVIDLGYSSERSAFYLRDNGMGFDMAHAHKLFGLFQRLHAGASAPGGTGVGLAIVARTLERHGGRIWAEAEPGVGATFWWSLPLV
ncbi:PAS domain-containing protein [Hydrogenophaga sp. RWCD_12]|uniref:PAS domain-containing protein n=1 Tax=Hydrogenophaga sp. RWCD_12 TaxID=3391190 RepID=UPI0039847A77